MPEANECIPVPMVEVPAGDENLAVFQRGLADWKRLFGIDRIAVEAQDPPAVFPGVFEACQGIGVLVIPFIKARHSWFKSLFDPAGWDRVTAYFEAWGYNTAAEAVGIDLEQLWNGPADQWSLYDTPLEELVDRMMFIGEQFREIYDVCDGKAIYFYPGVGSSELQPERRRRQILFTAAASAGYGQGATRHIYYEWSQANGWLPETSAEGLAICKHLGEPVPLVWCCGEALPKGRDLTVNDWAAAHPGEWPPVHPRYWLLREIPAVLTHLGRLGFPEALVYPGFFRWGESAQRIHTGGKRFEVS